MVLISFHLSSGNDPRIAIIFWAAVIAALFFMSDDAKRGALLLSWGVMIIWTLAVTVRWLLR
jgi:hypothetical protein